LKLRIADDTARFHRRAWRDDGFAAGCARAAGRGASDRGSKPGTLNEARRIDAFRKGLAETGFVEGRTETESEAAYAPIYVDDDCADGENNVTP
jgi:hypothetical protein